MESGIWTESTVLYMRSFDKFHALINAREQQKYILVASCQIIAKNKTYLFGLRVPFYIHISRMLNQITGRVKSSMKRFLLHLFLLTKKKIEMIGG